MQTDYDVIIIGSGPAGLTAGIYTSRADLKTLCVSGRTWGGQLMQTTLVENFPGFPEGIQGPELMANMRKQAEKFGVTFVDEDVTKVEFGHTPFVVKAENKEYRSRAVIIATGAEFNWLGLPSEQRLIGRGVSSCATCDAAFFRNKQVIVVGGGDAAMEEALVLAKFASKVTVVHRRAEFRASKIMQERVLHHEKIAVKWNSEITEVIGESKVEGVVFKNGEKMAVDGVFVAIGHSPMTNIFAGQVELDEKGFVKKINYGEVKNDKGKVIGAAFNMMTSVPGVFTAGDVHDLHYKQAITAAGYGCEAALEAEKWVTEV
jgi:thioredoxin reductase (NADPH)